jgi:peptidoglycan/LPS O-acetylase OafA/YrhL
MKVGVQQERAAISDGTVVAGELPALTGLRGLAALAVLLFHSSFLPFVHANGSPAAIWGRGYLAVDLFFFLSGFVLTHVYGSRLGEEWSWQAFGKFLWARFCRIYPASLFATAVFTFALGRFVFPDGVALKENLIASLLLIQVPLLDKVMLNPPSWSISAELYAYLLFPFIVPVILRMRGRVAAVLGITLLVGIAIDHIVFGHREQASGWGALIRSLPEFTAGVFAYRAYSQRLFLDFWERDATLLGVTAMIAAACIAGASDGLLVMLLLALLVAAVCNSGRMTGFLNAAPLRWLGEVSYSVYIFQALPLTLMLMASGLLAAHGFSGFELQLIGVLLALGSGVLVHRCIDLPARAALRRLPDQAVALATGYRKVAGRPSRLTPIAVPERDP